jgi:hypothetical protein
MKDKKPDSIEHSAIIISTRRPRGTPNTAVKSVTVLTVDQGTANVASFSSPYRLCLPVFR